MRASNHKKTYTTPKGTKVRLTVSQKDYADKKLENPKASLVAVAKEAYPNAQDNTLSQIVNQNEQNESIRIYSEDQVNQAKTNIVELANDDGIKAETRLKANQDILDREIGKAIQRTVSQNTNLNLNIDASKELADQFNQFIEQQTRAT